MIVILMGVSGVGKTTVGQALAAELKWGFVDADDYHSAANVAKMQAGIPLEDGDRAPWLAAMREAIEAWAEQKASVVLACSALKASYREVLVVGPEVKLVYLKAPVDVVAQRLAERHGHYMNPKLLRSQFETLEEPLDAVVVDAGQPVAELVREVRAALQV
jgi:gluconokinase